MLYKPQTYDDDTLHHNAHTTYPFKDFAFHALTHTHTPSILIINHSLSTIHRNANHNDCNEHIDTHTHAKLVTEGSLEVKLPTIWRDGKAEVGRVREEKKRSEKIREEKEREARRCRCAKR